MRSRVISVLGVFCILTIPFGTEAQEVNSVDLVYEALESNVRADFDADGGTTANTGLLNWSSGYKAQLKVVGSIFPDTAYCDVNGVVDNGVCTSSQGVASATFDTVSLHVDLYRDSGKTDYLGYFEASLWSTTAYTEAETQVDTPPDPGTDASALYGSALIVMDVWDVNDYEWYDVEGSTSIAGLTASTTNLDDTGNNISDYQSDWFSNNCLLTVTADETAIPEPATMALLGLGAAVLTRKRNRA